MLFSLYVVSQVKYLVWNRESAKYEPRKSVLGAQSRGPTFSRQSDATAASWARVAENRRHGVLIRACKESPDYGDGSPPPAWIDTSGPATAAVASARAAARALGWLRGLRAAWARSCTVWTARSTGTRPRCRWAARSDTSSKTDCAGMPLPRMALAMAAVSRVAHASWRRPHVWEATRASLTTRRLQVRQARRARQVRRP